MTLTRGARITGAVLCAVLALTAVAWIVRDVRAADGPVDVWAYWAGIADLRTALRPTTAHTSLVLLVVHVLAAVSALRSAAASSVLIATGLVTLGLRLPAVWLAADGPAPDDLRDRALITTYAVLAASVALIVVGVAGRRPVREGEERPAGPAPAAGVAAFLLLGLMGLVLLGWEIRHPFTLPPELYPAWFTGGRPLHVPLTEAPPGWSNGVLVVAFLAAAGGALARAAFARPLGLIVAGFALSSGVMGIARIIHYELYVSFARDTFEVQLTAVTAFVSFVVGAVAIAVLARKGVERAPAGSPGPWGGSGPWGPQAPGFGPPQGGFGPPRAPGFGPPQGGFGPPQGGGFAPPPPSSPPRGW
ncbi:hypothetical protein [Streptomyces sp. NPDC059452]|uniref:hypothetical protein n=1 Tax=Streptomyces sp. NPDC059452 TaxID=3346835 RepID=UPI003676E31A